MDPDLLQSLALIGISCALFLQTLHNRITRDRLTLLESKVFERIHGGSVGIKIHPLPEGE